MGVDLMKIALNICASCGILFRVLERSLKAPHRVVSYLPLPHVAGFFADVALPAYMVIHAKAAGSI